MTAVARGCLAGVLVLVVAGSVAAQESKSSTHARELAAAMDAAKLDTIAAKDPAGSDVFIAALYIPGTQLLVVSGKYSAPALLNEKLVQKAYRDVYLDLNGASVAGTKVFIEDTGADGLHAKRMDSGVDSVEVGGKRTTLDGDWKKQKLSEEDYTKTFSDADALYEHLLTALLGQAKKTS